MKKLIVMFSALFLAACDPLASKSIVITLKDNKNSAKAVLHAIDTTLSQADLRAINPEHSYYEGNITDGERHTKVQIFLKYDSNSDQIIVQSNQFFGSQLTPQMKRVLFEMASRIEGTGEVIKIDELLNHEAAKF